MKNSFFKRKKREAQLQQSNQEDFARELFTDLDRNLENLKKLLDHPFDLVTREFTIGNTNHRCAVAYIDGLTDNKFIGDKVVRNIQIEFTESGKELPDNAAAIVDQLNNRLLSVGKAESVTSLDKVAYAILSGDSALYVDGTDKVLTIGSKGWKNRSIEEPLSEGLIRGPREGFIEDVITNTVLIRRRIRDANLRFKSHQVRQTFQERSRCRLC